MSDSLTTGPGSKAHESNGRRGPRPAPISEATVWKSVPHGWRQLFGGFYELGVSIESHDFQAPGSFEWSRSFHPDSLELCLNLRGEGSIRCGQGEARFGPQTAGFYLPGRRGLTGWRQADQPHRFITVEFSPEYLRQRLAGFDGALHPLVEGLLRGSAGPAVGEIHRLGTQQEQRVASLLEPPVCQAARPLWYQSKVMEFMSEFFFERREPDELFCDRQKRLARERVERVLALLRQRLCDPPSLEEIGREARCSPFYLSRTFSRETGLTIPQYLRKLRMERAAELLRSGKFNVTEAALEVGYSSLSHFSQAFCQTMGCCPMLYPQAQSPKASGGALDPR